MQVVRAPVFGPNETVPALFVEIVDHPKRSYRINEPVDMTSLGGLVGLAVLRVVLDINTLSDDGRWKSRERPPLEGTDMKEDLFTSIFIFGKAEELFGHVLQYAHPFSDESHSAKTWGVS